MNITREEATQEVGLRLVEQVESEGVDFTNRVTEGTRHNGYTEFSASVGFADKENLQSTLTMYVYVDSDDVGAAEVLDQIDWDKAIESAEYRIS